MFYSQKVLRKKEKKNKENDFPLFDYTLENVK